MKIARRFRIVLIVSLMAALCWISVFEFQRYLHTPLTIADAQELNVAKGSTFGQVVRDLSARGMLRYPQLLQLYGRISNRGHRIHAGEYLLGPGTNPLDLLDMLEQGHVRTHAITMVEGWTLAQMRAQLAKD